MNYDQWTEKYKPIKNWLNKDDFDIDFFETYGVEIGVVLGVNRFNPKQVWTLVDGNEGAWITSGYHLVNRIKYFITKIPFEGEGNLDVLYDLYSDYDNEDAEEEDIAWIEKVSALASARPPMLIDTNSEFVYKLGSNVQAAWRKYGWTPPSEIKGENNEN